MKDAATIEKAVTGAHPRQALAMTIAHWELATKATSLLGSFPATLDEQPVSAAAGSLLMLASLTSKGGCAVEQPLPDQAMDTWQHATWPTGDTKLLCMSMMLAADERLQAFANSFGKSSAAGSGSGKLQQAVSAAATLLTHVTACVCEAMGPASGADEEDGEDPSQQPTQFQGLHPAVVGSMATRVFQLSDGNPNAAMALLVAAVLPEGELGTGAGQDAAGPSQAPRDASRRPSMDTQGEEEEGLTPAAQAQRARARSYRKRARSPSRSVNPAGLFSALRKCC